jgi:hypothetical protein
MCRSIKTLRRAEAPATEDEIQAASLQFVRKISGYRAPSRKNAAAFEAAVAEVGRASRRLLEAVDSTARPSTAKRARS